MFCRSLFVFLAFYPVDDFGYGTEGQTDCSGVLHNFVYVWINLFIFHIGTGCKGVLNERRPIFYVLVLNDYPREHA
jgi:hypothetical protein